MLADVPLFTAEVLRVLVPDGVVVWPNALGTDAPHPSRSTPCSARSTPRPAPPRSTR